VAKKSYNETKSLTDLVSRDASRLQFATSTLPRIYKSTVEIQRVRFQYLQELDSILAGSDLYIPDPMITIGSGSLGYYLIYQGFDDRSLRTKLTTIYKRANPQLLYVAPHVALLRDRIFISERIDIPFGSSTVAIKLQRRTRVGFVSAYMFHHSVGLLTEGVITR